MKTVTITELRRNIFQLIDEALATGEPLLVRRGGKRLILQRETSVLPPPKESEDERAERWRKFWAAPPEVDEDLSLEDIEAAGEAYWRPTEGPELDP